MGIFVRLILLIALIAAAMHFFKRIGKHPAPSKQAESPEIAAEPMVRCAHCGVHLPRDRALSLESNAGKQWYCSQTHLEQGPGSRDR
ncbi:PP0621 family protein [Pseudomonas sp. RTC3]|uniref:PP0621 family protein n=1 Tax=unclassified Pseudomonas TaxID=196821 RepID=UPI002AB5AD70|nr:MULTISPECIES: PP0621 family protein [unclassified Pseudomonas]MEB0065101.1 PP0621 family protein [Pseudomonas sp. RTC3]MDY7566511.1 PP0621 family protein [Pseudomonas sp. 5C2]MEB0009006.1 PP0621 family protein [Pseudomonas sp. RTB2]MEB0016791.1 PP0621 family protein [Pseudomonas sp. RTB3]MEB0024880.1 PP0621 family protein [Pseudomonas sp. MH9.2]